MEISFGHRLVGLRGGNKDGRRKETRTEGGRKQKREEEGNKDGRRKVTKTGGGG